MRIFSQRLTWLAAFTLSFLASATASAAPITFKFEFDGTPFHNTAKAVGWVTFEETTLANSWSDGSSFRYHVKEPAEVLDLDLTVTGATTGNGHFTLPDFGLVFWQTNGTLDFNQPLVGQPTHDAPWATTADFYSGDFNLRSSAGLAPDGTGPFRLATSGGNGDSMLLKSMVKSPVPEPMAYALMFAGLSVVGFTARRRRQG
ncbi:MAG: PEP-CTERM sorting domain-containing protein [Rubrivivax sp.]|nr:MAG: PEP-CTERM sorting domain-containing protein [Rubrivivax sp.]